MLTQLINITDTTLYHPKYKGTQPESRLTKSTEQSTSWEANSCSANQKIPCLSWNLKVYYFVHKNLPLDIIRSHTTPSHTSYHISLRYILILSSHLHLGLSTELFPSHYLTKILYGICEYTAKCNGRITSWNLALLGLWWWLNAIAFKHYRWEFLCKWVPFSGMAAIYVSIIS